MKESEKSGSYAHVLKYIGVFGGVGGLGIAVNLIRNKLVALLIGPAGMGLNSLFSSSLTFASNATSLGISFSAIRHLSELFAQGNEAETAGYVRVIRSWEAVTALMGTLVFALFGPLVALATGSDSHTGRTELLLLSPVVGMMAVTGGEMAVLKGVQRLRALAKTQIATVLATLVISVPLYWAFGMTAVAWVLLLTALVSMIIVLRVSLRVFPFAWKDLRWRRLGEGRQMVRLGLAFVCTGVVASGAEMLVRLFLSHSGGLDVIGLYNAGYVITVTYASTVFSSMESDYFPRLSAVNHDREAVGVLSNRQIEVSLVLIGPMLCLLMLLLPFLLPLLYSGRFAPVVSMAQVASLSMFFKAVSSPLSYIMLAKGHSKAFFLVEMTYALALTAFVTLGYNLAGLLGTGIGLAAAHAAEMALAAVYVGRRYHFRFSRATAAWMVAEGSAVCAVCLISLTARPLVCWTAGAGLTMASAATSVYYLAYRKTNLIKKIFRKR